MVVCAARRYVSMLLQGLIPAIHRSDLYVSCEEHVRGKSNQHQAFASHVDGWQVCIRLRMCPQNPTGMGHQAQQAGLILLDRGLGCRC